MAGPLSSDMLTRWRSLLFVPANVRRFVDKAAGLDVDIVILDLEDSIAPSAKDEARGAVAQAAAALRAAGKTVFVRINRPLQLAVRDIETALTADVAGLMLPKVIGPDHVRLLSELVGERERRAGIPAGRTRYIAVIEDCGGFMAMGAIAGCDARIFAMMLGPEDFATALGATDLAEAVHFPQQQMLIAARAAGLVPLGTVGGMPDFRDIDAFAETVRRSRRRGFEGAAVIHPALVPVLNEGFAPDEAEVAQARRIVAAYEEALARGVGAISLDNRMVDVPVVDRARAILRNAGVRPGHERGAN